MIFQKHGRYTLAARYLKTEDLWMGYMTSPDEDMTDILEDKIHGGFSVLTSEWCPEDKKYYSLLGFRAGKDSDSNISPHGVINLSYNTTDKVWTRDAVFEHLKEAIRDAELIRSYTPPRWPDDE